MAEAAFSATERALENQRLGALQIRVAALCALIQMCDGYDVGSIGWAVPSLTHAWSLPPPAFSLEPQRTDKPQILTLQAPPRLRPLPQRSSKRRRRASRRPLPSSSFR